MLRRSRIPRRKKGYHFHHIGLRQDSVGSIPRLQRSVGSRPLKKQQAVPIKIGDVVTFIYHSQRVHGIAKYIGKTDFSANTLCGVALSENVGKHNGTVKGKEYFECPDKHGVFVPLRKVSLAPTTLRPLIKKRLESAKEEEEEIEEEIEEKSTKEDMRITVRSYKAPQKLLTSNSASEMESVKSTIPQNKESPVKCVNNDRSTVSSNSSCDSGFESPTRFNREEKPKLASSSRRLKGKAKNIVVSSFIAESPQKPLIFNSFDEDSSPQLEQEQNQESIKKDKTNKTFEIDDLDAEVFEKEVRSSLTSEHVKTIVSEETCKEQVLTEEVESQSPILVSDDAEDGKSKIPKRVTAAAKIFEKLEQHKKSPSMVKSYTPSAPGPLTVKSPAVPSLVKSPTPSSGIRTRTTQIKRTTVTANISKFRQSSATSKTNAPVSSRKTSIEAPKVHSVLKSHSKFSSKPIAATPRKSSTVKQETVKKAGKDEDPSVVMGNSNATIHPSTKTVDSNVSEVYSQREISGAVVIERTKKTKTKTTQNSTIINDTKNIQPIDSVKLKELEQEIDNLNNQLKERKNRINELESSLQINNNNIEEEKNEFSKIQSSFKNELLLKDQSIQLQEDKLKVAKGLVDKSNRGLEALALVISHYVTQIEHTTSILNLSQSKSSKLENTITKITEEKCSLQSTVNELKDKLENESCRCEVLQKEYETLRLDHQAELSKINEEHVIELNKAVTQKQKEYDTKFQEILDKQNEDAEAHANEIKRLKEEHEKEKQELHNEKEKEARLSAEPPRLTSPGGTPIYTDKYNNMPEELKSLNIVLDLKNEELKNLRSKAMELERKLESHHDLQTKYDVLLQKHQSMSEMLKQRAHNERQLSVERESLMEKFENESKKVSRLSMEKEQLIWRASNPDLSYRSLTRFEEDEECDDDEERDSPPSPLRSSSGSFSANSTPRRPKGSADSEIAKKLKRRSMNF